MKSLNLVVILIILLSVSFLAGCQETKQTASKQEPMQVILVDTDTFPEEMVGIWSNEEHGWVLKFEKDGSIKKIRHTIGRANLVAGERFTFPLIDGGTGVIDPGPWYMQYNAKGRGVVVEITLKSFKYELGGNTISGSSRDIFAGTLPEKGDTTWAVEWISYPDYVASTADASYSDYELPFYEGTEDRGEIVFTKVDLSVLEK